MSTQERARNLMMRQQMQVKNRQESLRTRATAELKPEEGLQNLDQR